MVGFGKKSHSDTDKELLTFRSRSDRIVRIKKKEENFFTIPLVGVFWLNITNFKVNWSYRYCFKLFSKLRKENELRQYHCRNSTKVGERKIKSRREKFFIFDNGIAAIPSAHSVARVGKKNLAIVAMPLLKIKK